MAVVEHIFKPVYDENSRVLILGTMPSPKSRKNGFYYGHPQNRFWPVLADIFHEELPLTNEDRLAFLHRHHIALWDVLKSCDIEGASDASIKNPIPNDLSMILKQAPIHAVFTTNIPCIVLPSPNPANRRIKDEELKTQYQEILKYI